MFSTINPNEPLYSSLAVDPDLADIVEMFVDEMPERIQQFSETAQTGDWDSLKTLAHQLKGAAGSYGFDQVTPVAARLEMSLKESQPEDVIQDNLDALLEMIGRLHAGTPEG